MRKPANRKTVIYALLDPLNLEVRYIGKTNANINIRFTSHLREKKPSRKANWIRSIRIAGRTPNIEVLEELDASSEISDWQEAERFWISYFRFMGARLTNLTDGGEGLAGLIFTEEHKKRIGAANRGSKRSTETRAKMAESRKTVSCEHLRKLSESRRGKPLSDQHRAKLGNRWIGRKHTPETKLKMSLAAIGRKCPAETKANMSAAQKERTPEHQEKLTASKRGKALSEEHRAKLSTSHKSRKKLLETTDLV